MAKGTARSEALPQASSGDDLHPRTQDPSITSKSAVTRLTSPERITPIQPKVASLQSSEALPPISRPLLDDTSAVIIALRVNGSILGLSCSQTDIAQSHRPALNVPESLYPTPLQLAIPHHNWIDGWPFPRMRDNLIILKGNLDVNELFGDFARMDTFKITDGALSFDPKVWRIAPQFAAKWGYLFH